MRVSVIIPTLNEAEGIGSLLVSLQAWRAAGHALIVSDGGSDDATVEVAAPFVDIIIDAPRGRALQMNAGAMRARGDVLWFLHADSIPPPEAPALIARAMQNGPARWGRFDVRLSGERGALRMVGALMNWRSRLTGIATGDQGIFVETELFREAGGFPPIALMEDVALSAKLKRFTRPACLREHIVTSSRRWEKNGVARTIAQMWRLRLAYWWGANPADLAKRYYPRKADG
jgi:rSAM/selenodomain-associated transferase 2